MQTSREQGRSGQPADQWLQLSHQRLDSSHGCSRHCVGVRFISEDMEDAVVQTIFLWLSIHLEAQVPDVPLRNAAAHYLIVSEPDDVGMIRNNVGTGGRDHRTTHHCR